MMMTAPRIPSVLLALALAVAPAPGQDGSRATRTSHTPFFETVEEREIVERRNYDLHAAEFDLFSTDWDVEAAMVGGALSQSARIEQMPQLEGCLLAVGTDVFAGLSPSPQTGAEAFPYGLLIHEGRWIASPQGLFSAFGLTADHRPVFATNWLEGEPRSPLAVEVETQDGRRHPVAAVNRAPAADSLTILTWEYSSEREFDPEDARARIAVLVPSGGNAPAAPESVGGAGRTVESLVYKTYAGEPVRAIGRDMTLVCGLGKAAEWIEQHLDRNARVKVHYRSPSPWSDVREGVGLGAPLIWEGRVVGPESLTAEARELWGDLSEPSGPALAYLPREKRLRVVWSESLRRPRESIGRRALVQRLFEAGARWAVEFAGPADSLPLFLNGEWIGREALNRQSPRAPTALLFRAADPEDKERWINLCRKGRVTTSSVSSFEPRGSPQAVVDSRYGPDTDQDHVWSAPVEPDAQTWLEIDLQRRCNVFRLEIHHAESAGFSPHYNTAAFRIVGRPRDTGSWIVLDEIQDNESAKTIVDFPEPQSLLQLRLEIQEPSRFPNSPNARIAEVIAWGWPER
jgi:hypothetical protein